MVLETDGGLVDRNDLCYKEEYKEGYKKSCKEEYKQGCREEYTKKKDTDRVSANIVYGAVLYM